MVTSEPEVTMKKPVLDVKHPQLDMKQPLSDAVSGVEPLSDLRIPPQTGKLAEISQCLLMKMNNENVGAPQSGQQVGDVSKTRTTKNEYVLPDHVSCFEFIDCHVEWFYISTKHANDCVYIFLYIHIYIIMYVCAQLNHRCSIVFFFRWVLMYIPAN